MPSRQWQKKHISLSDGCFTWSAKALAYVIDPRSLGRSKTHSSIDFFLTPCVALPAEGHPDRIVLRPLDGCVWSPDDLHRGAGTGRDFVFDIGCSGVARDDWLARFAEHIAVAHSSEPEPGSPGGGCCGSLGSFGDYIARAFAGTGSPPEASGNDSSPTRQQQADRGGAQEEVRPLKELADARAAGTCQVAGNFLAAPAVRGPGAIGGA